jgi:hypothetical protein
LKKKELFLPFCKTFQRLLNNIVCIDQKNSQSVRVEYWFKLFLQHVAFIREYFFSKKTFPGQKIAFKKVTLGEILQIVT